MFIKLKRDGYPFEDEAGLFMRRKRVVFNYGIATAVVR